MKIPDITPFLVYPDDPDYVTQATKHWTALHQQWSKDAEEIKMQVINKHFGTFAKVEQK